MIKLKSLLPQSPYQYPRIKQGNRNLTTSFPEGLSIEADNADFHKPERAGNTLAITVLWQNDTMKKTN